MAIPAVTIPAATVRVGAATPSSIARTSQQRHTQQSTPKMHSVGVLIAVPAPCCDRHDRHRGRIHTGINRYGTGGYRYVPVLYPQRGATAMYRFNLVRQIPVPDLTVGSTCRLVRARVFVCTCQWRCGGPRRRLSAGRGLHCSWAALRPTRASTQDSTLATCQHLLSGGWGWLGDEASVDVGTHNDLAVYRSMQQHMYGGVSKE